MTWQTDLHNKVNQICPIKSIRIIDKYVKFTWEIIYQKDATEKQKQLAEDVINNFDIKIVDIPEKTEADMLNEKIRELQTQIDALKVSSFTNTKARS